MNTVTEVLYVPVTTRQKRLVIDNSNVYDMLSIVRDFIAKHAPACAQ